MRAASDEGIDLPEVGEARVVETNIPNAQHATSTGWSAVINTRDPVRGGQPRYYAVRYTQSVTPRDDTTRVYTCNPWGTPNWHSCVEEKGGSVAPGNLDTFSHHELIVPDGIREDWYDF